MKALLPISVKMSGKNSLTDLSLFQMIFTALSWVLPKKYTDKRYLLVEEPFGSLQKWYIGYVSSKINVSLVEPQSSTWRLHVM